MRLNPVLERLTPYRAGPPVADIQARYQLEKVARLSANESPYGPFPEVIEAMKAALDGLNRYPDGGCSDLRRLLSQRLQVPEDHLVFGNGSCELLMLLGEAFLSPKNHAVFPQPSFVMYRSIALAHGAPFTAPPLPELEYDLEAMLAAVTENTSLLIICNPNNPTGSYVEPGVLRAFLHRVPKDTAVVLDEAYREFVTSPAQEDSAAWVVAHPNLVVLRTFSKIYGLAGLRLGYGIAHPEVIQALDKLRQPFNVDSLAQIAAAEALRHPELMDQRRELAAMERHRMAQSLQSMGVGCRPSQANFLLVDVTALSIPGPEVAQALLENGVMTRSGYAMECPGWIRVTIGEAEENDLFLSVMRKLREAPAVQVGPHVVNGMSAEALSPES
jgi:histidinol-phosphate aminotransferase